MFFFFLSLFILFLFILNNEIHTVIICHWPHFSQVFSLETMNDAPTSNYNYNIIIIIMNYVNLCWSCYYYFCQAIQCMNWILNFIFVRIYFLLFIVGMIEPPWKWFSGSNQLFLLNSISNIFFVIIHPKRFDFVLSFRKFQFGTKK